MHIVVFFTFGVSLKLWKDMGLMERELRIYKKIIDDGHRVSLVTYGDKTDISCCITPKGMAVIPVYNFLKRPSSRMLRFLQSFFIPFYFCGLFTSADIFKTNQMMGAWVPAIAKLLYRKKLVVRCGYELYRNLTSLRSRLSMSRFKIAAAWLLENIIYRLADRNIITSESNYQFLQATFQIDPQKISLIRNYVDVDVFCPQIIEKYENRVLYVGRIEQEKNLMALLYALEGTSCGLDIIGEGSQKEALQNYSQNHNLAVRFLGTFPNDELPGLVNRYCVYILPSFFENSPKALLEAMSCGLAVIGTDVDGIREFIVHEYNGLLCHTNPNSIRQSITRLMTNRDFRVKIGKKARKFVVENCSLNELYQKELTLFEGILSREHPNITYT